MNASAIMTESPAVSVLLPVRNGAAYLDAALESLAVQSFTDFEIILIDNGSTDATPKIVRRWLEKEPRLRAVRKWPAGLGAALREAANLARAPLLARIDADDLAEPDRLLRQVEAMRRMPSLVLLGSAAYLIDRNGAVVGEIHNPLSNVELGAALREQCPILQSSAVMRTEAYRRAGGYRAGLNLCEDFDLWGRIAEVGEIGNLAEPLARYRIHSDSATSRQPVRMALASLCVSAAESARRGRRPEPFASGVPLLRAALAELGISRATARRLIRMRVFRHRASRYWLSMPLPARLKRSARRLGDRGGLRRSYLLVLRTLFGARPPDAARLVAARHQ
jgi:glycosyltransferase involved in cell wall biosynthesis